MMMLHYFPAYWGIEKDAPDHSFFTRSTLHEVLPPFRQSIWAFRIRVSHRHWLHVGKYEYGGFAGRWGLDVPVEDISQWRGPNAQAEEDGDTAAVEVRSLDGERSDQLCGSGDWPLG